MYQITTSGNLYHNGILVPQDDSRAEWIAFKAFENAGGIPEYIECTPEELQQEIDKKAAAIKTVYSARITKLVSEYLEKKEFDGEPVPQHILDERQRLKDECNLKIADLGGSATEYR